MPRYRLEAAPGVPGLLIPVDNRTNKSPLAVHNGTPVIVGIATANAVLEALNSLGD